MSGVIRARADRNAVFTEMLEQLKYVNAHLTQAAEKTGSGVVNHVLEVATRTFPTSGLLVLEFGVPCGSILVNNVGNATVTVHAAGPQATAPTDGVGVYKVATGTDRAVNVGGRQVTLYGTAGQQVCYQALTVGLAFIPGAWTS